MHACAIARRVEYLRVWVCTYQNRCQPRSAVWALLRQMREAQPSRLPRSTPVGIDARDHRGGRRFGAQKALWQLLLAKTQRKDLQIYIREHHQSRESLPSFTPYHLSGLHLPLSPSVAFSLSHTCATAPVAGSQYANATPPSKQLRALACDRGGSKERSAGEGDAGHGAVSRGETRLGEVRSRGVRE